MIWVLLFFFGIYLVVVAAMNKIPQWLQTQSRPLVAILGVVTALVGLGFTITT